MLSLESWRSERLKDLKVLETLDLCGTSPQQKSQSELGIFMDFQVPHRPQCPTKSGSIEMDWKRRQSYLPKPCKAIVEPEYANPIRQPRLASLCKTLTLIDKRSCLRSNTIVWGWVVHDFHLLAWEELNPPRDAFKIKSIDIVPFSSAQFLATLSALVIGWACVTCACSHLWLCCIFPAFPLSLTAFPSTPIFPSQPSTTNSNRIETERSISQKSHLGSPSLHKLQ